jgi:hypothetical protein
MSIQPENIEGMVVKLLERGMSPSHIANMLSVDLSYVQSFSTERLNRVSDAEEISVAMQHLIWRGFEEAMNILDEGTPAMKIRLIGTIQSHALRFLKQEQPKEFIEMQEEFSSMLSEMGADDTTDSIYDQPDAIIHVVEDTPDSDA